MRVWPALLTSVWLLFGAGTVMAQRTVIEVGVAPAQNKWIFEEVAKAFMQRNPSIDVRLRTAASYLELTQQILREALVGGGPNVSHQAYSQIRILVERGLAFALDDFIKAESDWAARGDAASVTAMGAVQGRLYGMPFWTSLPVVFFNADLVQKAGGDPANFPQTWDEIIKLGARIQALGERVSGFYYIYKNTDWSFQALVFSEGGRLLSDDEKTVAFDEPAGARAVARLDAFARAGMPEMTREQARQAFAAGALGILVDASSLLPNIEKQADGSFKVGVAVHPIPSPDGRLPVGGNAMMILTKNSDRQKAAWEYVKFASGPVGQTLMVKNTGSLPISLAAVTQDDLLGQFYRDRPNQRALLAALPKMTGWFAFPGPNANKIVSVIEDYVERVATRKLAASEGVQAMKRDVDALLPK